MRLINTRTLQLEEFYGTAPDYAILSHTWEGDEVSFDEFTQPQKGTHHGQRYAKITAACRQALSDEINYCWVDTCCIAKASSAELTESINSMFNWYKQAKVCLAFLADFDLDVDIQAPLEVRIAKCRWFTRGWCLQELVAPKEVRFYDRNWRFIGTKKSLRRHISDITGVPQHVLEDPSHLQAIPVAKRMAWASKRETTRVEDIAYSLLGIFGINMPLLYGEGDNAFLRLQEEITKKCNDMSIFAWESNTTGQNSRYLGTFAPSPRLFDACRHMPNTTLHRQITSRSQFAISNRGIQFTAPDIFLLNDITNQEGADYVLPLCSLSGQATLHKCLMLRKVGPGLYVRSGPLKDLELSKLYRRWTLEKEIYLLAQVTTDLYPTFDSSHGSSFEFRAIDSQSGSFSIQRLEPRDAWDTPRSRFLTNGDPSFVAYLKVYPELVSGLGTEFFVITLGFCQGDQAKEMEPFVYLVHPDVWGLYDAPGRPLGSMVRSSMKHQDACEGAESWDGTTIGLSRHKVSVAVQTRVSRGLPVHRVTMTWVD